jgi:hypothetical protein
MGRKESKAIQVDTYKVKNIKHSQLQTVSIIMSDIQVQTDGILHSSESVQGSSDSGDVISECDLEKQCGITLHFMHRIESHKFDCEYGRVGTAKCIHLVNILILQANLKSQLCVVQNQVLETRRLLDTRKHQDSEISNLISRLKSDISQAEFVASVSHEDLEHKLDTIESLKSKVILLEEEIAIERNRTSLFHKEPLENCSKGTNTFIVNICIYSRKFATGELCQWKSFLQSRFVLVKAIQNL